MPKTTGDPPPKWIAPIELIELSELPLRGFSYEIKFDGVRAFAWKHAGRYTLTSRDQNDLGRKYPTAVAIVRESLAEIPASSFLLEGEIVALDENGRSSFELLQGSGRTPAPIAFYAFDAWFIEGTDLRGRPIEERKVKLEQLAAGTSVRTSPALPGTPAAIGELARAHRLEGVIAKRKGATHRDGGWFKWKLEIEQEFVVGGYVPGGIGIDRLLVGYYEGNLLRYAAAVEGGLERRKRLAFEEVLKKIQTDVCPFDRVSDINGTHRERVVWVEPRVVVQIKFLEWTSSGRLRHPKFVGVRTDKSPRDVRRETLADLRTR